MVSLQFITHQTERYSYLESARMALEGGCKWIQLRMKEAPLEEVEAVALQLKPLCKEHEAILVLDDHVELARKLEVDGVRMHWRLVEVSVVSMQKAREACLVRRLTSLLISPRLMVQKVLLTSLLQKMVHANLPLLNS